MKTFSEFLTEKQSCILFSRKQIEDLEKFADRLLNKFGIDVEFTRHFADRMGDSRNDPCIGLAELQKLFKKIQRDKGAKIKAVQDGQAVLVDLQKDLNLPFVLEPDGDEFELTLKTIMRKPNFATSNQKVTYEERE